MKDQHSCRSCGNNFFGKYCNLCGEKRYNEKDKKLHHIFEEAFHFITHFEGSFFNTLKVILKRPGKLSVDYCNGIRKKYFKPISFFLMLVILYLLFPFFEGLNMKLPYHVQHFAYGNYALSKTKEVLEVKGWSEAQLAESFHAKGEKTSKFLLFIVLPVMGFVSYGLGFRRRKLYFDHFIFSTEISSFFILWGFLLLPFIVVLFSLAGYRPLQSENQTALAIFSVFLVYLFFAARRFFQFSWWYALLYAMLFGMIMVIFLEVVYKFILFFVAIRLV